MRPTYATLRRRAYVYTPRPGESAPADTNESIRGDRVCRIR